MTAPTEAEIREAIEDRNRRYRKDASDRLAEAVDTALDALAYIEIDDGLGDHSGAVVLSDLWTDLRPSEAARLRELIDVARQRLLASLWPMVVDAALEAGVTFAREYPDAPRAVQEAVA